jgi:hypothetical protein
VSVMILEWGRQETYCRSLPASGTQGANVTSVLRTHHHEAGFGHIRVGGHRMRCIVTSDSVRYKLPHCGEFLQCCPTFILPKRDSWSEIRGFHSDVYLHGGLLDCCAMWHFGSVPTFRRNVVPPSSMTFHLGTGCHVMQRQWQTTC